jgi:hypothetical protein
LTKVSVYVDDSVWINFKEKVFQKHGNLRRLSSEVEKLLRDSAVETQVVSEFERLGVKVKGTVSSQEIKAKRPPSRGPPSEEVLAEMRRKRVAEAVPRQ